MRIIIPVLGFGKAGGHRVLSNFATEWTSMKHDVLFLCPEDYHDLYYPTSAKIVYVSTLYSWLPGFLCNKITRDFFGLLSLFVALLRHARSGDVILANRDLTAFPTRLIALWRRAAGCYYIQAYEPDFYEFSNSLLRAAARHISAASYRLHLRRIVNAPIYRNYREIVADWVVPPGLNLTIFHPKEIEGASQAQTPGKPWIVGCIGRAQAWKGTGDIVAAVQILRGKGHDIELHVAFHLADEFKCHDWIRHHQPHGDDKLACFYRSCDVFIAAGKIQYGGFHYPAAEALASGTILVGSPYFPANNENAYIFEECLPENIALALEEALRDDEHRHRTKTAEGLRSVASLSWKDAASRFLTCL